MSIQTSSIPTFAIMRFNHSRYVAFNGHFTKEPNMLGKSIACGLLLSILLIGCNKDNTTAPSAPKTTAQMDANQAKLDARSAAQSAADATRDAGNAVKNAAIASTQPSPQNTAP